MGKNGIGWTIAATAVIAAVTYGVGTIIEGVAYSGWAAVGYAALGAGVASLQLLNQKKGPDARNGIDDIVVSTSIRNQPVPVVFGRVRLGGNYLLLGNFFRIKDNLNQTPSRRIYVLNAILGLCEGPIKVMGNIRQDGTNKHDLANQEKEADKHYNYLLITGTSTDAQTADITNVSPAACYPTLANLPPWHNTAKLRIKTIVDIPHLVQVNVDSVGGDFDLLEQNDLPDDFLGHTPGYAFYDGYTESFFYVITGGDAMAKMPRAGVNADTLEAEVRSMTAAPSGVTGVTLGWYIGKHDVLVFQNPDDPSFFHIGFWGITAGSTDWETFQPSPEGDYANPILAHYLDEWHGILHTLHSDGTVRYIMRWTLLTGRIERTDTDLDDLEYLGIMFSPDFAAYIIAATGDHLIVIDQKAGRKTTDSTSISTSNFLGLCVSGQRIGVIANSGVKYYDPVYDATDADLLGGTAGGSELNEGNFTLAQAAIQNSWTGHVTLTCVYSGDAAFINFIPSVDEVREDLSALGTQGRRKSDGTFVPYNEFQTYPPPNPATGWVRDWSWRHYSHYFLHQLQGAGSLAAVAWASCVSYLPKDTARWGAGLDRRDFSMSSFEHIHAFCVGGVQYPNEPIEDTEDTDAGRTYRYAERCKTDYFLGNPISAASLLSTELLAACNGYRYAPGGKLHVGVKKPGVFPAWHFNDQNIQSGSGTTSYVVPRANRVRVQYKRVLDEYRGDFAEWNDEYDQLVKGRVIPETIAISSIGRLGHGKWLALSVGNLLSARRQFSFKSSFLAYAMVAHDSIEVSYEANAISHMVAFVSSITENEQGEIAIDTIEHIATLDILRQEANNPPPVSGPGAPPESDSCLTISGTTDTTVVWWASGSAFAAATYYISYVTGAYQPGEGWNYAVFGYNIVTRASDGTISTLAAAPAISESAPGYTLPEDGYAANAGQNITVTLATDGPIGIELPTTAIDNDRGPNPSYKLCLRTYYQASTCDGVSFTPVNVWLLNIGQVLPYGFTDTSTGICYTIPAGSVAKLIPGYIPVEIVEGSCCPIFPDCYSDTGTVRTALTEFQFDFDVRCTLIGISGYNLASYDIDTAVGILESYIAPSFVDRSTIIVTNDSTTYATYFTDTNQFKDAAGIAHTGPYTLADVANGLRVLLSTKMTMETYDTQVGHSSAGEVTADFADVSAAIVANKAAAVADFPGSITSYPTGGPLDRIAADIEISSAVFSYNDSGTSLYGGQTKYRCQAGTLGFSTFPFGASVSFNLISHSFGRVGSAPGAPGGKDSTYNDYGTGLVEDQWKEIDNVNVAAGAVSVISGSIGSTSIPGWLTPDPTTPGDVQIQGFYVENGVAIFTWKFRCVL